MLKSGVSSKKNNLFYKIITFIILSFWIIFLTAVSFNIIEKKLIYPVAYTNEIDSAAINYGLDRALILSVIKTESDFNENAISDKGAIGLMQITPATGEYIAKKRGKINYNLSDASTNIDFGSYYIKYLREKFHGLTETMAAYNAGEGTVSKWLKDPYCSDDGIHLTLIPYKETDRYVKKILKTLKRYRKLYGNLLDKS